MRDGLEQDEENEDDCEYIHEVPLGISTIEDMSTELSSRDRAHVLICWGDDNENLVLTNLDPRSLHRVVADFARAFESSRVNVRLRSKSRGQSLAVAAVIALSAITIVAAAVCFFAAVK